MGLRRFAAVLLDLDGTIYHEDHPLPGAVDLINWLDANKLKYACVTNATIGPREITERLAGMNVRLDPAHIYTAAAATVDHVLATYPGGRVFNLATQTIQDMLEGKLELVATDASSCDVVICGNLVSKHAIDDERKRAALRFLRGGADLVGICADRVYPSPRGIEFGVGALAHLLGYAANKPPTFCGKPEPRFFHDLCAHLNVDPKQCVLIGDNLESDIAGARRVGMTTILTLTGVTGSQDLEHLTPEQRPDRVVSSLAELVARE